MEKLKMRFRAILLLLAALSGSTLAGQGQLSIGDEMPSFKLPYATKDTISFDGYGSEDLAGTTYVIAFYPAAWSSGCTREVCSFRDAFTNFQDLKVEILPVSGDYVFTHHEWARHHNLPFKLLADHTREFGRSMGVYNADRGMFERSVFVVDPDGRIAYIDREYSVADNSDFEALKKALGESATEKK
jgi:peroxiredoxin